MDDFGAQDTEWKSVQITEQQEQHNKHGAENVTESSCINRLEGQGKAPIHVEFASFGYRHGMPSELRAASTGNSYAKPLLDIDCRCLAEIPHYLAWMDGTSGAVRTAMLKNNSNENPFVRDFVRESMVEPVVKAVIAAVDEGGYGYTMPLRMIVFVGSEHGRHRSVVAVELAATSLRKALRQNENNQFKTTVSVNTSHRDIDQNQQQAQKNRKNVSKTIPKPMGRKHNDLDDDL